MGGSNSKPMPKEVCSKNWVHLFDFIENTPAFSTGLSGRSAVDKLLDGLLYNPKFLISDPGNPDLTYPVKEEHLKSEKYWHSYDFSSKLLENAAIVIGGYRPLFKAGIFVGYRTLETALPKRFQIPRIFSPKIIFKFMEPMNRKFNKTKAPQTIEYRAGFSKVKINWKSEYKNRVSKHVCDWNMGIYTGMAKFTGAYDTKVIETECLTKGDQDCIFELNWTRHYLFRRLIIFFHSIVDPGYIIERDLDNLSLNYMLLTQEGIIEQRTEELKNTQALLVEAEKNTLEHRITGGFAHEIRNALAGAQLEFKTTLNYKDKGKSSIDILKDSATILLKNIINIHEKYNISKDEISKYFIPELKTIAEIADHLSITVSGVSKDIDRGLAITSQIRDYAKMAEFKAGGDKVNLMELIDGYRDRYAKDFEFYNIQYFVKGPEKAIVKADETHLNSIFSNLILNAKDALVEQGSNNSAINVFVDNHSHDSANKIVVEVQDNGPGIPEKYINDIFEPFFSTKPTLGTGLGLGIVRRMVRLYGGDIEVQSTVGTGTLFKIIFPETISG